MQQETECVLELVGVRGSLKAGILGLLALNKINTKLTGGDRHDGTNGAVVCLGQKFSNLSEHQHPLEDWLKQLSRPHPPPQSFSFSSSGMGPENLHF